jgi:2-polyprenyl-3-methyl-5-hydroxy-6-metoxy-1,4-benzoquinol methylase
MRLACRWRRPQWGDECVDTSHRKVTRESEGDGLEHLPGAYVAWRASVLGRVTDALEQELILDPIGPPSGLRILEVGCGDGELAVELAARGASVVGIDASPQMIAAARDRALRAGRENEARFEVARVERLSFESENFDAVVAVTVLCFVENAAAALQTVAHALQPDGRLIVGELGRWNTWATIRRVEGWFGSPIWKQARFRSASELKRLALDAGFVSVTVKGAVFYPPIGVAARLLRPIDRRLGTVTTMGAAFLALARSAPRREAGVFVHVRPEEAVLSEAARADSAVSRRAREGWRAGSVEAEFAFNPRICGTLPAGSRC